MKWDDDSFSRFVSTSGGVRKMSELTCLKRQTPEEARTSDSPKYIILLSLPCIRQEKEHFRSSAFL